MITSTNPIKYPRTYHLPWSEGKTSDDKVISSISQFNGRRVIVTEKMDGENTTLARDYIHARSVDSKNHPSRDWVKQFWSNIRWDIPEGWRVCGENLYARHSISYDNLPSYFLGFSLWELDRCLAWDETLEWFDALGILSVPILYDGVFDQQIIQRLWTGKGEGYVIRVADSFRLDEFSSYAGKFVRENHVQTDIHWTNNWTPNKLKQRD